MNNPDYHPIVCFGEVLWDILPKGAVPGGAPMNVAYHLNKLKKNPALITSVGEDERGRELLDIFTAHHVCTTFFQVSSKYETGKVYAEPNEYNEVVYDIVKPVAWDFINYENHLNDLVSKAAYFVYGTLAARNDTSKKTLLQLLESAHTKVLDINLRPPHFDKRTVEELLKKADFLKINEAELELITGWFSKYTTLEERIRSLTDRFQISNLVVTLGGLGAQFYYEGHMYVHQGFPVIVKDTVGSGDAFLAGLLARIVDKASPENALEFANALGAFIATQNGACPNYELNQVEKIIQEKDQFTNINSISSNQ